MAVMGSKLKVYKKRAQEKKSLKVQKKTPLHSCVLAYASSTAAHSGSAGGTESNQTLQTASRERQNPPSLQSLAASR